MTPKPRAVADLQSGFAFGRTTLGDPSLTSEDDRRRVLELLIRTDPLLMPVLRAARRLALPDWRLVSGAVYQSVWNALTGRPSGHGIKDIDLVYFDGGDLGYEAEDAVIARAGAVMAGVEPPVEVRNQARVHRWYEARFGQPYPRLACTDEALLYYAARTHAVGVRLEADNRLSIAAPFGLADVFAMRLVPNPVLDNSATYTEKALRMKATWPEIEILPWPHATAGRDGALEAGETAGGDSPAKDAGDTPEATASSAPTSPAPAPTPPGSHDPADPARDWMTLSTSPRTELPK